MKKILLLSVLMLFASFAFTQNGYWEKVKAPPGGIFDLTKTSDGTLYAQQGFGSAIVYRSTNGGESWEFLSFLQQALPAIPNSDKFFMVGANGTLFLRADESDINSTDISWYKTTDDGQSWLPMNILTEYFYGVLERPSGILFSSNGSNILRSLDSGQSWESFPVPFNIGYSLVNDPYVGLLAQIRNLSEGSNTFFHSPDDGLTWDTLHVPFNIDNYAFSPSGTFYCIRKANLPYYEILRTADGGSTFQSIGDSIKSYSVNISCLLNGRILLQTETGISYSDDDGVSWQVLQTQHDGIFQYISPLSDGKIFMNANESLLSSEDGGLSWQFSGTGMDYATVIDLKYVTDSLLYSYTPNGAWKTVDAGETWTQLSQNYRGANFPGPKIQITNFGGVVLLQDHQLLWSANGEDNFVDITPPDSLSALGNPFGRNTIYCNPINNHFFTNTKLGLQRSEDLGQTWEFSVNLGSYSSGLYFHPTGKIFYAKTRLHVSDDNGNSWQVVNIPNLTAVISCSIASNGDIYIGGNSNAGIRIWKSTDLGLTWTIIPLLPNLGTWYGGLIEGTEMGHLYIESDMGIFFTPNNGLSWQNIPSIGGNYGNKKLFTLLPDQRLYVSANNTLFRSISPVSQGAYIEGHVNIDADADCSTLDAQEPLKNKIVEAIGSNYTSYTNTDAEGYYIFFVDTGAYQVSVQNPSGIWWDYCQDAIEVDLSVLYLTDTADFVAIPLSFCPLLTVNVAIPRLRRCFDNQVFVEYCNQGTEPADSAWVDVMLDPYLSFVSSAQSHEPQPNNTIRFFVGDISSGDCGQFQLTVHVNCDSTVLGQTHCVTAHGFPDTLCTTVPNWSGANIEATVSCQDTTLQFNLKNTGTAQSQTLEYIIIEDDVVLMNGQENYDVAEDLVLNLPANGSTWRIESAQEPGHPFSTLALAFAEGCGGFNSLGYINQFPVNGIQPSWHTMCAENAGSFDPNDKQGFPNGVGAEHNIRPGQAIDYLIRFQNTGTDTAFTVFIQDTLSAFLDPISIRPGASSHPYTWNLSGQGVISFTFNNIMLPDSNVNEAGSHGFVQFNITPYADIPLGSVIENKAEIYFDFNEPVITNKTWHTIEKSPLISAIRPEPKISETGLEIWPNPCQDRTNIHFAKKASGIHSLHVFDHFGKQVSQKTVSGSNIELRTLQLPAGVYWVEVRDPQGKSIARGKLVKA